MLNSLFEENFDLENTKISISNNEFVTEELSILRGDLFLTVSGTKKPEPYHYHIEFQTLNDATMVIRMFEYGFKKARELARYDNGGETILIIPRQLVIFIEQNNNIKDELKLKIIFPDTEEIIYTVPVMKYWEYDHKDLLKRKLYPLLPLQVFKLRYKMEQIKGKQTGSKQSLIETILEAKQIAEEVALEGKHLYDSNEINGDDLHKILLAIESIFAYLNNKYTKISILNEEVYKMAKTLYDPAVEQRGIEKGIEKGLKEGILDLLMEKDDYHLLSKVLAKKLDTQTETETLKKILKKAARTPSVKHLLEELASL
jgi:hypothetical protein